MTFKEIDSLYQDITNLRELKAFTAVPYNDVKGLSVISVTRTVYSSIHGPTTLSMDLKNMPDLQAIIYDYIVHYKEHLEEKFNSINIKEENK